MAITTLAGTTWRLNDTLSLIVDSNYYVNFSVVEWGITKNYVCIKKMASKLYFNDGSENTTIYVPNVNGSCCYLYGSLFQEITFIDGQDIENANLISWLQSNAVLKGKHALGSTDDERLFIGNDVISSIYAGESKIYNDRDYLYFEAIDDGGANIAFNLSTVSFAYPPSLFYKINNGSWNNYTYGSTISLNKNDKCYWKGNNDTFSTDETYYIYFSSTGMVASNGNIMSLLDETCQLTILGDANSYGYNFYKLFYNCSTLVSAPKLTAKYIKWTHNYSYMFYGCTALEKAPEISCVWHSAHGDMGSMFEGCTSLTYVPNIYIAPPAMYNKKYPSRLFANCTSLYVSDTQTEEAPYEWELPKGYGTGMYCYQAFVNCLGARANDSITTTDMATYYTQHEPIG